MYSIYISINSEKILKNFNRKRYLTEFDTYENKSVILLHNIDFLLVTNDRRKTLFLSIIYLRFRLGTVEQ